MNIKNSKMKRTLLKSFKIKEIKNMLPEPDDTLKTNLYKTIPVDFGNREKLKPKKFKISFAIGIIMICGYLLFYIFNNEIKRKDEFIPTKVVELNYDEFKPTIVVEITEEDRINN